jgi:hypothetical protein
VRQILIDHATMASYDYSLRGMLANQLLKARYNSIAKTLKRV